MKRALLVIAVIATFFIGALVWMANDSSFAEGGFDQFSIENTSGSGLSIAQAYLARTGHRVIRLDDPLRPNAIPHDAVVIRAGRLGMPHSFDEEETSPRSGSKEKKKREGAKAKPKSKKQGRAIDLTKRVTPLLDGAEDEWVRAGGRLVLATTSDVGPLKLRGVKRAMAQKVFPIWPQLASIAVPTPRVIEASTLPPRMHALFTIDGGPVIARELLGRGDVIVIAAPEILQNDSIRRPGAILLLESLAPPNRPIYFDESIHGFDGNDGAVTLMKEWALGPFLMLAALAAILYFWRDASRIGPAEDDHRETRSDAIDLVRSLGTLYMKSMTDEEALAMYRDTLVRSVAAHTGLRGDALVRRVADLTGGFTPPQRTPKRAAARRHIFKRHLDALNAAFGKLEHGRTTRAAGELNANHR